MNSEQMQSEIAQLNTEIDMCEDPRSGWRLVQERIRAYRQAGKSVPEELARLERSMATECLGRVAGPLSPRRRLRRQSTVGRRFRRGWL